MSGAGWNVRLQMAVRPAEALRVGRRCVTCRRTRDKQDFGLLQDPECQFCKAAANRARLDGRYRAELDPRLGVAVAEKRCGMCGQVKPAGAFPRKSRNADGIHSECRDCCAKRHFQKTAAGR